MMLGNVASRPGAVRTWDEWNAAKTIRETEWEGVPVLQHPCDLYLYAEAVHDTHPQLVVETGTHLGGSALFFRSLGLRVVTVDIVQRITSRPGIRTVAGDSVHPAIFREAERLASGTWRRMVALDSSHRAEHVALELELYAPLVSPGCFLVVNDVIQGWGVDVHDDPGDPGPGPAVVDWLAGHSSEWALVEPRYPSWHAWLRRIP